MKAGQRADVIKSVLRMSQKALGWTLALIGVGYIGGLISICIKPELSQPLSQYAEIFTPVWQVEIAAYGVGSTLEKLPLKKQNMNQNIDSDDDSNG